jgi:hypothetical protein
VRLQERILLPRARLHVLPTGAETYWRASINRFACLTASSFTV